MPVCMRIPKPQAITTPGKPNIEKENIMNALDPIKTELTYADLLDLRTELHAWAADLNLSDSFRALCGAAAKAIGQCSETDPATHPDVVRALECLNQSAITECPELAIRFDLFEQLDAAPDADAWRGILVDLVPHLTDGQVLGLRCLIMDIAADFQPGVC